MDRLPDHKVNQRVPLWICILVLFVLYTLQGVTLGIVEAVPLYMASLGATWKLQSTLSLANYPLILKLLWAPLVDVYYIRQLGKRLTWLLPAQLVLGITLIVLSFYFEVLLVQLRIITLTVILFFIVLFVATQDICVDGWALTLLSSSNVIWQPISQVTGYWLGSFLGSPFLLAFESANMTNKLIRQPFGMAAQPYGLFTLGQFVKFWGVMFLFTTCLVMICFRKRQQKIDISEKDHGHRQVNLLDTYLYILRVFKKKNFLQFLIILIGGQIAFGATSGMTSITLISRGLITRAQLALITMPFVLIKIIIPLSLSHIKRPLFFYAHAYVPRVVICLLIAVFIFGSAYLQYNSTIFYVLLLVLLGVGDIVMCMHVTVRGSFMAYISDPRIGSTYYTLVASLHNLGQYILNSTVLYVADWLPKEQAYFIEVGVCLLLGCVWLCISWRLLHRLQMLPLERWHLTLHSPHLDEDHQQNYPLAIADKKEVELLTIAPDP